MFRYIFALLALCCAPPLYAADAPARMNVSYDVTTSGFKITTIDEVFTSQHGHYHIESTSRAVGPLALIKPETIQVVSDGLVTPQGLRPLTFSSRRKLDSDRNAAASFDWEHQQITLDDKQGKRTLPLPEGTQDRLSTMYQFMFLQLQKSTHLDFYMTNGNKVDIYNYLLTHDQSVTTPLGTFSALYVANPVKAGESRTEIWLAVEHKNFPYQMIITTPEGDRFTQVLTKFELEP